MKRALPLLLLVACGSEPTPTVQPDYVTELYRLPVHLELGAVDYGPLVHDLAIDVAVGMVGADWWVVQNARVPVYVRREGAEIPPLDCDAPFISYEAPAGACPSETRLQDQAMEAVRCIVGEPPGDVPWEDLKSFANGLNWIYLCGGQLG